MTRKQVKQFNIPLGFDFKYRNGDWAKSFRVGFGDYAEIYHTRLSLLWSSISKRCENGGDYQKSRPTYIGVCNQFTYQSLGDWANNQEAYFNRDKSGRFWHLDKDILSGGRIYSPETCCFVPSFINSLLTTANRRRGDLPLGVTACRGRYISRCHDGYGGESIFLGSFPDKMVAHSHYQEFKLKTIRESADRYYKMNGSREDVYHALLDKAFLISKDLENEEQTIVI